MKKLNTGYLSRQTMHDMRRCYDKVKAEPYGLHGFTEEDLQRMAMMLCLYEHRKIRESLADIGDLDFMNKEDTTILEDLTQCDKWAKPWDD